MRIFAFLLITLSSICCFGQKTEKISVYFKFNKYDLDHTSKRKIDSLIRNNTIEQVFLQGHCDSIGDNKYNDALSQFRVDEVKRYMVSKNIQENIIEIRALGKRAPLNKNENENARALNRRVEIEFVFKKITVVKIPDKAIIKDTVKIPVKAIAVRDPNAREVEINGIVLDENKKPIVAEISLNDKNGNEVLNIPSDRDGKFRFVAPLNKKDDYSLVFYNDERFIDAKTISLSNPKFPFRNLTSILPQLKDGGKYVLKNMNFVGDTSQLISSSVSSLFALYKVMKKNTSLVIRIEGHVNWPTRFNTLNNERPRASHWYPPRMNQKQFNQWLSEERAKTVYNYLVNKGIDPKRLSTIGYGSERMLFPDAMDEADQEANRRVEINVISFR
jgi:outer membrane protein OmpA-like peptidoglycan-associated protein